MRANAALLTIALLAGCASGGSRSPQTTADLELRFGTPAMQWSETEGGETRVYPEGPQGFRTWFVRSDAQGHILSRENALVAERFARIQAAMGENEVLQLIGPPVPHWTIYYEARDELVWEWRYCDDWNEPARFNVMFDGTTRRVRFTYAAPEHLRGLSGFGDFRGWCGH